MSATASAIRTARRVDRFTYAIRNIVTEAKKVEAAGTRVRYLNIGDPNQFGFLTPPHLIDAVVKAMRDGHNGYTPSPGIAEAREAAAADFVARGVDVSADRVLITSGTSEGIELALTGIVDEGDEVLVPSPTYPLYTAVLAKIGAHPVYYRTDHTNDWLPDLDHLRRAITPKTRALVVIDPNNPTGALYPDATRRALIEIADAHGLVILADEVYGDLSYDGAVAPMAALDNDAAIISYSSLSKAYLAPGWRAGWMAVGRTPRLDQALAAIKKLADGRLCSPGPMQYAVTAALTGDRSHQVTFRRELRERAELTARRMNAIPGISCVVPKSAFYAMPKVELPPGNSDVDFVLGLLRSKGVLCVYGSGFGTTPEDGFFRIVFLASPRELDAIYDDVDAFTRAYRSA
ncbi:MAG TPA: aminotransferase class I/II-fold pyridoxal phosphate-dependent enzyme [Vicinamibacterales bacterium]|nr:aminotransferase class I/II-fold pyridoxal phosphate-dependent enzyme [Vicinamibacterales bacterium]